MSEPDAGGTNSGTSGEEPNDDKTGDDDLHENDPRRNGMPRVNARIPPAVDEALEDAIEAGRFSSKSDAVRAALRQTLNGGV